MGRGNKSARISVYGHANSSTWCRSHIQSSKKSPVEYVHGNGLIIFLIFQGQENFNIPLKVWSSDVRVVLMEYGFGKRVERRRSQFGVGNIQPQLQCRTQPHTYTFRVRAQRIHLPPFQLELLATIAWKIFWSTAFNRFNPKNPHFIDRSLIPVSQKH